MPLMTIPQKFLKISLMKWRIWTLKNLIITGDWNLINDFEKDTFNYRKLNNPKAQQIVTEYKNKLDLIDIWRQAHPNDSKFT